MDKPDSGLDRAGHHVFVLEAAGTVEHLADAGRLSILANRGLKGERSKNAEAVTAEAFLTALDLRPVDPVRHRLELGPELLELGILIVVVTQQSVEVGLCGRRYLAVGFELSFVSFG